MATKAVLTKADAKRVFEKLGIKVDENQVKVGRFFIVSDKERARCITSPFSVCGDGIDGLGVCFVYEFSGKIPSADKDEDDYVLYVRAFSGTHSREASIIPKKNAKLVRYDLPYRSFMADGREWRVIDGEIVHYNHKEYK